MTSQSTNASKAPAMMSVTEMRRELDRGAISAVELAQDCLRRIEQLSPVGDGSRLNAMIDVQPELTFAQARAADARLAAGERLPLLGIPLAHKDIFVTQGWRSTAGSRMLESYISPFNATVVEKTAAAGMVCVGKANCDEFAMGSSNENSYFGEVRNPWDLGRVPGGSSGGSAVAVAARLAPLSTGTDTGGSIRQPASLTGLTGLKPSYGRVSRWGMIAYASSLDQGGPMGSSARDVAMLLDAMAGFDPKDSTSLTQAPPCFADDMLTRRCESTASQPLAGLRVGVPGEFFGEGLAADVRSAVEAALKQFEALGAVCVPVQLPRTQLSIPSYYVIAPAEASSNLSRFDGVRYGHRAKDYTDLASMYANTRSEGFGAEVRRRILVGTYVLSHGYYDAYYIKAQQLRRLISDDFTQAFQSCDLIAGPVSPTTAWGLGEKSADPVAMYLADIYTLSANLAGLPAMSIPCGFGADGMPVGLQLMGPYLEEVRLLHAADAYQQATDWHQRLSQITLDGRI